MDRGRSGGRELLPVEGSDGGAPRRRLQAAAVVAVLMAAGAAGCLSLFEETGWQLVDVSQEAGFTEVVGSEVAAGGRHMDTLVGGISAADVDGDGWTDLFVADAGPNRLHLNQGDGTFREVWDGAGIAGGNRTSMGLFLDVDDDGDLDLFVVNHGTPDRLLENRGDGTFRDVTEEAGLGAPSWAYAASAADVDGDGDLDVSVANYGTMGATSPQPWSNATNGERDLLYVNQGDGSFREVGRERGIDATRWTFSHAWADHDEDGDPDLYVNVDFGRDVLYENDGTGRFTEVTRRAGTVTDENGMGAHWVDVDNDLDLDLFATNIHVPGAEVPHFRGNDLFMQGEDGAFEDRARERGIHAGGWGWDSAWADLDHDGDVDAFQANGMTSAEGLDLYYDGTPRIRPEGPALQQNAVDMGRYNGTHHLYFELPEGESWHWGQTAGGYQVDRVFLNDGTGRFRDAAAEVGVESWSDSRGLAVLDVDRDGDLDVARAAYDEPVTLLENRAVEGRDGGRHWLQVDLVGTESNRDAVGARVVVEAGDRRVLRHATAGGGILFQDQAALHVGLGEAESVDELRVTWPSGETASFRDLAADQMVRITEPRDLETGVWAGS